MEKYIPLICLIFIIIAILLEMKIFFQNLSNLPLQESELLMVPTKPIQEPKKTSAKLNRSLISPNSYYSEPSGCPGFGC